MKRSLEDRATAAGVKLARSFEDADVQALLWMCASPNMLRDYSIPQLRGEAEAFMDVVEHAAASLRIAMKAMCRFLDAFMDYERSIGKRPPRGVTPPPLVETRDVAVTS